jgi:hypothetical protein
MDYDPIETSSPAALPRHSTYATQPTQILTHSNPRISDIVVPASSPDRPVLSNEQQRVFNRMAPPGTYLAAPARPPSPTYSQTQVGLQQQFSDDDEGAGILATDSEDELTKVDLANIPAAKVMQGPPRTLVNGGNFASMWAFRPNESQQSNRSTNTSTSTSRESSFTTTSRLADVLLHHKVQRIKTVLTDVPEDKIAEVLRAHRGNETDAMAALLTADDDMPIRKSVKAVPQASSRGIAKPTVSSVGVLKKQSPRKVPTMKTTLKNHKSMAEK